MENLQYRCPYCHDWVANRNREAHQRTHAGTRPDGQNTEYVTLPPEARSQQSLDGVPRIYFHARCGTHTGMPEEIIRSYLKNPYLYTADMSFCAGCHRHVSCRELTWTETGENMQTYNDRLRAARPDLRPPWYVSLLYWLTTRR